MSILAIIRAYDLSGSLREHNAAGGVYLWWVKENADETADVVEPRPSPPKRVAGSGLRLAGPAAAEIQVGTS